MARIVQRERLALFGMLRVHVHDTRLTMRQGDGAWAPKVPQHKPAKQHRRGRGGPRSSATHHAGNEHGSADSDAHSGSSSSDDEDRMDKVGGLECAVRVHNISTAWADGG